MNNLVLANLELRLKLAEHEPAQLGGGRRLEDLPDEALQALLEMAEQEIAQPEQSL